MSEPKKWNLGPKLLATSVAALMLSIGLCSVHEAKLQGWGVFLFLASPVLFLAGLVALLVDVMRDKR